MPKKSIGTAVGVQARGPGGRVAARVAVAREVAGHDLRRRVGRVHARVDRARHGLVGLDGVGLGEHAHVGLVPVVEQPHLRIAAERRRTRSRRDPGRRAARRSAQRRRWPRPARARTRAARPGRRGGSARRRRRATPSRRRDREGCAAAPGAAVRSPPSRRTGERPRRPPRGRRAAPTGTRAARRRR